jgi:hypothetical protein
MLNEECGRKSGVLMKRFMFVFLLAMALECGALFAGDSQDGSANNAAMNKIPMYLCISSEPSKTESGKAYHKMVYGYVNGQRTECMTEEEFRARFVLPHELPDPPKMSEQKVSPAARTSLAGADFKNCDLMGMNFQNADLHGARFDNSDLRTCNLHNSDLRNANLEGAYLKDADLSEADLSGANLKGAYLTGANLIGVRGLTIEILRMVQTLFCAKLDPPLLDQVKQYCPGKLVDRSWQWGKREEKK